jgi:hypothetical protein
MGRLSNDSSSTGSLMSKPAAKSRSIPVRIINPFRACDSCGYAHDGGPIARAKHQVNVPGGTLYFCNHHFTEHAIIFIAADYRCVRV